MHSEYNNGNNSADTQYLEEEKAPYHNTAGSR